MPILSSDFDAGNNNGYAFSSNGVSLAIEAGVTLLTNSIGGVAGVYDPTGVDSARVANDGTIVSSTGVYIGGD